MYCIVLIRPIYSISTLGPDKVNAGQATEVKKEKKRVNEKEKRLVKFGRDMEADGETSEGGGSRDMTAAPVNSVLCSQAGRRT